MANPSVADGLSGCDVEKCAARATGNNGGDRTTPIPAALA
jgi:hypothetical protein